MKDFFSNLFKKATDFVSEQAQNLEKLKESLTEQLNQQGQEKEPQAFEQIHDGTEGLKFRLPDGAILTINSPAYASRKFKNGHLAFYHYDFTEKGVKTYSLSKGEDAKDFEKLTIVEAPFEKWLNWGHQHVEWEQSWVSIGLVDESGVQYQSYKSGSHKVDYTNCRYDFSLSFGHLTPEKPRDFEACHALWAYIESKLPESMKAEFEAGKAERQECLAKAISTYQNHLEQQAYFEKMDVIVAERKQELIDAGEWEEPTQEDNTSSYSSSNSSTKKETKEKPTQSPTQAGGKVKNISIKIKNDTDAPFNVYHQDGGGSYRLAKNVITTIKMDEGDKLFYYEGGKKGHLILTAAPDMEGKVQNYSKL
jgi:hypothetical protein